MTKYFDTRQQGDPDECADEWYDEIALIARRMKLKWKEPKRPLPNLILGTSIEDQATADERIPHLLRCPAVCRVLSVEPLLGPINGLLNCPSCGYTRQDCGIHMDHHLCDRPAPEIDWVIVGGESGQKAKPCDISWIRSIVSQCRAAGVVCFVKQLGSCASDPENGLAGKHLSVPAEASPLISTRLTHPNGGDPSEWPDYLRVREYPEILDAVHAPMELTCDDG